MNRRKFFAFLPLAPVAAIAVAEEAKAKPSTEGAPIAETVRMTLCASKPSKRKENGFLTIYNTEQDPTKQVSMAVGDDGSPWIKNSSDEWKRVVTE